MGVNELVCFNIRYLAKRKGIKIGELEKRLKVRVGYFSRKVKTDSNIAFETVYNAAKILDTSIDDLCSNKMLKEIEELVSDFGYTLTEKHK